MGLRNSTITKQEMALNRLTRISYNSSLQSVCKNSNNNMGKIKELPAEILVHIFQQIPDLRAITKCYNTNVRWQRIVEEMFKNNGKKAFE